MSSDFIITAAVLKNPVRGGFGELSYVTVNGIRVKWAPTKYKIS